MTTVTKIFNTQLTEFLSDPAWERLKEKDVYANWLAQTHFYVSHSANLLALTGARLHNQKKYDLFTHLSEESHHEDDVLKDLEALGMSINEFQESSATKSFYMTQYFYVEHINPYSFYGYILFLEGMAAKFNQKLLKEINKSHGEKSCSFLNEHVSLDPHHIKEAFKMIKSINNDEIIIENFIHSMDLYKQWFYEVVAIPADDKQVA
jgi:pyrroloquinoline quinone (PQQ) biosynthesis protein C